MQEIVTQIAVIALVFCGVTVFIAIIAGGILRLMEMSRNKSEKKAA